KKFFARHLELYGHNRHARVGRLKPIILKLKWKTKGNFHDCGIFTLLHMESFKVELLQIGIINLHAKNILELAKEFDKVDSTERMSIIIEEVRNREQRDRI
ncbi:hypothetical protein Tco_1022866, partial [Tanacetum coccineum]